MDSEQEDRSSFTSNSKETNKKPGEKTEEESRNSKDLKRVRMSKEKEDRGFRYWEGVFI